MTLTQGGREEDAGRGPAPAGVLDRALDVLDAVRDGHRSLATIARRTGLPRTTVHRTLNALVERSLLEWQGGHGYRLGPRLLQLAAASLQDLGLRDAGHAELVRLAEVTGESAQIYVLGLHSRICVDAVPSANELRTIVPVGAELPLTAGSAGKVFLAWMNPDSRERYLRAWERLTDETPTPDELSRELTMIRRRGWAQSVGERKSAVGSVSAPILGGGGSTVVGVVSISGPRGRIGKISAKGFAPAVLRAAREIERAAGYQA